MDRVYKAIRRCLRLAEIDHPNFGDVDHSRTASELFEAYKRDTPHQYSIGDIYQNRGYVGPLVDESIQAQTRSDQIRSDTGKTIAKKKRKKKRKSHIADKSKDAESGWSIDDW